MPDLDSARTLSSTFGAGTDPAPSVTQPSIENPDDLPPGTKLGSYVIESTLGAGGGGTVFLARHAVLGRRAAIKVLRTDMVQSRVGVARFLREARVTNMIRHSAIVDIYEFSEMPDGRPYFVMELLEGSDLSHLIAARGRFPAEEALEIIAQLCSALTAAHDAGVVHRDLKASNIHVAVRDGHYHIKLLDFGIAKLQNPGPGFHALTRSGTRLGTATSMAPEQIRGEVVDHKADIYALGILIFQMLTGRYPFRGSTRQETDRLSLEAPPPRPSQLVPVSSELDQVVLRCLDKVPSRRFESVKAVEEAFGAAVRRAGPAPGIIAKRAVGVLVEAHCPEGAEGDEGWLDDVMDILDAGDTALQGAGLTLLLHTTTSLLGVRLLAETPDAAYEEVQAVQSSAVAFAMSMESRPGAHQGVKVYVRIHVDDAEVDGSAASVVGGPITDLLYWPSESVLAWTPAESGNRSIR